MKLHLPVLLRRILMASAACAACAATVADAAIYHSQVSMITYTDFGQNCGRYAVGNVNALLNYIRQQEGGIVVHYVNDSHPAYTLLHGMIDFSSQIDNGHGAMIDYDFYATVQHNGVWSGTVTANYLGTGNAIQYIGIEYRASNQFLLTPATDYKITRMSKITTDVTPSVVYGQADGDWSALQDGSLRGQLLYRAGSGSHGGSYLDGTTYRLAGAYGYITGGIMNIGNINTIGSDGSLGANTYMNYSADGISAAFPIPFMAQGGDSGSPAWIWNTNTGQYEYILAAQAISGNTNTYYKGAPQWTVETMESFVKTVNAGNTSEIRIYSASTPTGETITDNYNRVAQPYQGRITDANGNLLTNYIGVKTGVNTWKDLAELKDTDNWYNYGSAYFNREGSNGNGTAADVSSATALCQADLLQTESLVFVASKEDNTIRVMEDTDLGIGYIRLSKSTDLQHASYTVTGDSTYTLLNSAGYVVDAGVSLHLQLTNSADYMREWRAVVETGGEMFIEGSGDTNALLNIGGQGTVYLNRTGGYSAYNVLANNGVAVVISDINQIKRDFTFGYRGGVLDMNGLSMTWNNDNTSEAAGFTIHALDEQAIITNTKAGATTTLTWTQAGEQTWLGSFIDAEEANLKFVYNGGADSSLAMHSIHTSLTNKGSGITVRSGALSLSGTNTVHGKGSLSGRNANRYFSEDDWHYADATTNVTVESGATFELGSHARLKGNVTVAEGGNLVIREGVKYEYEYIEGGERLESTYAIRAFYGLFGNISNDGTLSFSYSKGTTAQNVYTGDISGTGSLSIDLGTDGAVLMLTGDNTMTGAREIASGGVILGKTGAFYGTDTSKWVIGEKGWLAAEGTASADLLAHIATSSAGSLALATDTTTQLGMSGHTKLFIGAEQGKTVQYGTAETSDPLATWHVEGGRNQWLLGGGDGNLYVNWKLTGDNDLVLGNAYMSGTVTLTNSANDFTGNIIFSGEGNVVLNFTSVAALGKAKVSLTYGKAMSGGGNVASMLSGTIINGDADGILLLDDNPTGTISLASHSSLHLGANGSNVNFSGTISVANNGTYYFGGPGTLILNNTLAANGVNNLMVDAEGFSGGSIVLKSAAAITGDVTVTGYTAGNSANISSGSISLTLGADNALQSARSVTAEDGGILGIGQGTTQNMTILAVNDAGEVLLSDNSHLVVSGLTLANGGSIDGLGHNNEVQVQSGSIAGTVNVGALIKTGADTTLTIADGNSLNCDYVAVKAGHLSLAANMNPSGTVFLYNGTDLTTNGHTVNGDITAVENSTIIATANGGLTGTLDVAEGATLAITGNTFTSASRTTHLSSGGTLDLTGLKQFNVNAAAESGQVFNGTVVMGDTTIKNPTGANAMYMEFDHLDIRGNARIAQDSWNTDWTIHKLTGEGSFTFDASTTHWFTSTVTLDGEGDLNGTITLNRTYGNSSGYRRFDATIVLSHELAVQNADISLLGKGTYDYAALALNADRVQFKGLSSESAKSYAVVYAGGALSAPQADAPASTRNTTLVLTGDGTYTYYGGVIGDADHAISLLKTGSGTQTFTDGCDANIAADKVAVFGDVTVLGGALALNTTTTTVHGNYTIGQSATLAVADGLDLVEGKTLTIAALDGSNASAELSSALTLGGGALAFSGKGLQQMNDGSYLLSLTGGLFSATGLTSLTVAFTDVSYIQDDRTYYLSSGDFYSLGYTTYTATGVDHYTATFNATENGLTVTFSAKDGNLVWNGTDAAHTWSSAQFSTKTIPDGTTNFAFTDAAANKNVVITESAEFGKAMFDSVENYTVTSNSGNGITLDTLEKGSAGDLDLQSGISVTGGTVLNGGRILIHDASTLSGSISGSGTLVLAGAGANVTNLVGTLNTLEVMDGGTGTINSSTSGADTEISLVINNALVHEGGTLNVNCAATTAVTLDGGTLSMGGGSSLASLLVSADSTLNIASGATSFATASSTGETVLTVTGGGTLQLNGANPTVSRFNVESGRLYVTSGYVQTIESITLGSGSSLEFAMGTGMAGVAIDMQDGSSIYMRNGTGSYKNLNANITTSGTVTIKGSESGNSTVINGSIIGSGILQMSPGAFSNTITYKASIADKSAESPLKVTIGQCNVALNGANSYSGGTEITNAYSVYTYSATAFGTGLVTVNGSSKVYIKTDLTLSALQGGGNANSLFSAENRTLTFTGAAGDHTFSTAVRDVSLVKLGDGTQAFTAAGNINAVSVQGGGLGLSGTELNLLGAVEVAGNATLSLGGTISLAQAISNSGTVNIAEGTGFTLSKSDFDANNRYVIVSGTGTATSSLRLSDFTIDGTNAQEMANLGINLTLTATSSEIYLTALLSSLTWNGASTDVWDLGEGNKVWLKDDGTTATRYVDYSTVYFTASGAKNVSVSATSSVTPLEMNISGTGYAFTGDAITIAQRLILGEGASATFGNAVSTKDATLGANATAGFGSAFGATGDVGLGEKAGLTVTGAATVGGALTLGSQATATFGGSLTAGSITLDSKAAVTVNGALTATSITLGSNATATLNGAYGTGGDTALAVATGANGTLNVAQSGSIKLSGSGTLNVASGAVVSLGTPSDAINYHLAGAGEVRMNGNGKNLLSLNNAFSGTLVITLSNHLFMGTATTGNQNFAAGDDGKYVNLRLEGGNWSNGIVLNSCYRGTQDDYSNAMKIGSLAGGSKTVIRGDQNVGHAAERYIVLLNNGETTFEGKFIQSGGTSVGLIMKGSATDIITLTRTDNASTAALVAESGTIALSGKWEGNLEAKSGGRISLLSGCAFGDDTTIKLAGTGTASNGALGLANGVSVAKAVTIADGGATIMTDSGVAASLTGTLSGDTMTKIGAGTLTLGGATTLSSIAVTEGTLSLAGAMTLGSAISNSGTVEFATGVSFHIDASSFVDNRYEIVTGSGNTTGTLSLASIYIDGVAANASSTVYTLTGIGTGTVCLTYNNDSRRLIWNGTADSAEWNTTDNFWLSGNDETHFSDSDTVSFTSEATGKSVVIANGGVTATDVSISAEGYQFSGGSLTVNRGMSLGNGASATFANAVAISDGGMTLETEGNASVTFSGALSGGALTKAGTGTLTAVSTALTSLSSVSLQAGDTVLSDTLGETANLSKITLGADATLSANLATADTGTLLTLNASSAGTLHVTGGMLRTDSTIGTGSLQMENGSGLSFNSGDSTFSTDFSVATGGTVSIDSANTGNTVSSAISGSGTLAKTGSGTVALSGDMSGFSGTLNVAAGTLLLETDFSPASLGFGADASLKVGTGNALTLTVDTQKFYSYVNNISADATHQGTVDVTLSDYTTLSNLQKTLNVGANYVLTTNYSANAWNDSSSYTGVINVGENGSLTLANNKTLTLGTWATLNINGGSVTAGKLVIGHSETNNTYDGRLFLSSGSLSVNSIQFNRTNGSGGHVSTLSMTGGTLNLTGSGELVALSTGGSSYLLSLTGGEVKTGGAYTVGTNVTLGGVTFSNAEGAAEGAGLTFSAGNTVTWDGNVITNNGTALTFNGTIALSGSAESSATYYDAKAPTSGNGYSSILFATITNGGTITFGENANGFVSGNRAYLQPSGGTYYIRTGTFDYGSAANSATADTTTGLSLLADSTLNIAAGTTLDNAIVTKNGHTLTVDGSGVFVNGIGSTQNANIGSTWTGTYVISGTLQAIILNNFGRGGNSTVRCTDAEGWIKVANPTANVNLELVNGTAGYGLYLNGTSGKEYTFNGKVSGSGDLVIGIGRENDNDTFTFSGDVSEWTGGIRHSDTNGKATTLKFTKDGDTTLGMSSISSTGSGTLDVQISGSGDKVFAGTISGATLTMNGSGTLTFSQQTAMTGDKLVINSGTVELTNHDNGTAQLSGTQIEVYGGGTLKIGHDSMGWNDSASSTTATASVLLRGTDADHLAVLLNNDTTNPQYGNTCSYTIDMQGNALVTATQDGNGKVLRIWNSAAINATGLDNTIETTLKLDKALTITVGSNETPQSELTVSGAFTSNQTLTKEGVGRLILSGANTADSALNINAGVVEISGENGVWSHNVTVASGAQLDLRKSGAVTSGKTLSLAGSGTDNNGALALANGVTVGNAITIANDGAAVMTDSGAAASLTGTVSGGALTKLGAGSLTLSGSTSLSGITVSAGTLTLGGTVTLADTIGNSGTVSFADGVSIALASSVFTDNSFTIVSGGSTSGALSLANITIDGTSAATMERYSLSGATLAYAAVQDLVWNGTADEGGHTWDRGRNNWLSGESAARFYNDDNVSFTGTANKSVVVDNGGVTAASVSITGSGYTFSGGAVTVSGAMTLGANASAAFTNALTVGGTVNLGNGSTLKIDNGGTTNLSVATGNDNTGTLEVASGSTANLGYVYGDVKYLLAGDGKIQMTAAVSDGNYFNFLSIGNTFSGTLEIDLTKHVFVGTSTVGQQTFAATDGKYVDLVLKGGDATNKYGLILNSAYVGINNAMNIGSLSSSSTSAVIRGDKDVTSSSKLLRYIHLHQDTETEYAGKVICVEHVSYGVVSVGLIMDGTGTLKLTGANTSLAELIARKGTIELSGNGQWSGDVQVESGGRLVIKKDEAVATGKSITLAGNGTASNGALDLANGVTVGNAITIANDGAAVMTDSGAAASLTGTVSGGTLTKLGAGTLTIAQDATLDGLDVQAGSLTLTGGASLAGNATVAGGATLAISGDASLTLSNGATLTGATSVAGGATLTLGGTINLGSTISSNGSVVFNDGIVIAVLESGFTDNAFTIVSGNGSTTSGLTLANFTINGQSAQAMRDNGLNVVLSGDGTSTVTLTYTPTQTLTWNGTSSSTWGDANWSDGESDTASFAALDSVLFTDVEGVNKAVTVTDGGVKTSTVTIEGSGYSFRGGSVEAATDLVLAANATASFGSALTVDGSVSLGENSTLTVSGGLTVENSPIRVEEFRTLAINGGSVSASTRIILDGGTLALGGTTTDAPSALTLASDSTISAADGATVTISSVVGEPSGSTLTLDSGSGATVNLTPTSALSNVGALKVTGEGTVVLAGGTVAVALKGDGNVTVNNGAGNVTISGDNSSFTGTMTLAGTGKHLFETANSMGGVGATMVTSGDFYITTHDSRTHNIAANIEVNGTAKIDGYSTESYTFTGTITNNGTNAKLQLKPGSSYTFDGDVSGFEGTLELLEANPAHTVYMHSSLSSNAIVTGSNTKGSNFHTNGSSDIDIAASLQGTISVYQDGTAETTYSGANTYTGTTTVSDGTMNVTGSIQNSSRYTVSGEGTLKLSGSGYIAAGGDSGVKISAKQAATYSLRARSVESEATLNNAEITASGITRQSASGMGSVDGAQVEITSTNFTISHVELTNTLLELKQSSSVTMTDAVIGTGTVISNDDSATPATLNISNSTLVLNSVDKGAPSVLYASSYTEVALASFDLAHASLSGLFTIELTTDFMTAWKDLTVATPETKTLQITLGNVTNAASLTSSDFAVTATSTAVPTLCHNANGTVILCVDIKDVPEPTTGTLTVLALAALAARRRRNK